MAYQLPKEAWDYVNAHGEELVELVRTLCGIPAPSYHEHKRSAFCKQWLEAAGAKGVYVDSMLNVIYPVNAEGSDRLTVFAAHMDTVFPELEPLPFVEKDDRFYCPGAFDNTATVAVLLMVARYIAQNNIQPEEGFLIVVNGCEEGLGNLNGIKQVCDDYAGRLKQVICLDSEYSRVGNWPVGCTKFEVKVKAEGGHAYLAFGNQSALVIMAEIIRDLYAVELPEGPAHRPKKSFNVGTIKAGTSVNAIPETCEILYECRAEVGENLKYLEEHFAAVIKKHQDMGRDVEAKCLGGAPCIGDVDMAVQKALEDKARDLVQTYCKMDPLFRSGTGDCNIPLSRGIPAVCYGGCLGWGAHTREEWLDVESLKTGLPLVMAVILSSV